MARTARVRNKERLKRKFLAMPRIARREIEKGLEVSAVEMVGEMERFAPKETGELVESIGWRWVPKGFRRIVARIFAGAGDAFHARFQEFGTVDQDAQPFFFPIYRALRRRARRRVGRAVGKAGRIAARRS